MRAYLPLSEDDIDLLSRGDSLAVEGRLAVSPTPGLAVSMETTDEEELDLIAALSAVDLAESTSAVAVLEAEGVVVDDAIGEVALTGSVPLSDVQCLLVGDLESQEVSWFGIQELDHLQAAVKATHKEQK